MQTKHTSIILPFLLLALAVYVHRNSKKEHIFGLGGKSKQTSESNTVFKDIREKITDINKKNSTKIDQSAFNENKLEITIKNVLDGCDMQAKQNIASKQVTVVNITDDLSTELEETVTRELSQQAAAEIEKKQDVFGAAANILGGGTDQDVQTNIDTEIKDITKDVFNTANLTKIKQKVYNNNEGKLTIKNCSGSLKFDQNIANDQVAEAITESLIKKIQKSRFQAIADQTSKTKASQEDTTVSSVTDMISGIFDGYFMMIAALGCAGICSCFGCLLIVGMLMMSGEGDQVVAGIGAVGNAASRTMAAKYGTNA